MDINQIKRLHSSMVEHGFSNLKLEISKDSKLELVIDNYSIPSNNQELKNFDSEEIEEFPSTQIEIRSDKVGTFSFLNKNIKCGDNIKKGEMIGIVDGISFKEQVKCSVNGTISLINISEGEIVDYGRLLFVVDI